MYIYIFLHVGLSHAWNLALLAPLPPYPTSPTPPLTLLSYLTLHFLTTEGPVLVGGACEYLLTTLPHVDPPVFQLNCTTMNSPATRANWTLNGSPAPSSNAASFQTVTNFAGAIYSNVLVVIGRIAGSYVCNVTTRRMEVPNNSENIGNDTLIGAPAIGNVTVEG